MTEETIFIKNWQKNHHKRELWQKNLMKTENLITKKWKKSQFQGRKCDIILNFQARHNKNSYNSCKGYILGAQWYFCCSHATNTSKYMCLLKEACWRQKTKWNVKIVKTTLCMTTGCYVLFVAIICSTDMNLGSNSRYGSNESKRHLKSRENFIILCYHGIQYAYISA